MTAPLTPPPPPEPVDVGVVNDPTPLRFTGVYLLTGGPDGLAAVPDARLDLDRNGITATATDGTAVWSAPWADVTGLATPERSTLPDGGTGVVLAIVSRADAQRFVLPTTQPSAVEDVLHTLALCRDLDGAASATGDVADALLVRPPPPQPEPTAEEPAAEPEVAAEPAVAAVPPVGAGPEVAAEPAPEPHRRARRARARTRGRRRRTPEADPSPPILVVIPALMVTGGAVAVLLLAAGHVIHV